MKRYKSKYLLIMFAVLFTAFLIWDQVAHRPVSSAQLTLPTSLPKVEIVGLNEEKLFHLINQWRKSEGKNPYKKSDQLCEIAKTRVGDIKTNFSHTKLKETIDKICKKQCTVQENIVEQFSEKEALNSWLNSPPHRATLEKPYPYSCVKTSGSYAVQIFGYE